MFDPAPRGRDKIFGGERLGPRLGRKFKRDGGAPMLPHDLTIAVSGGLILWFGWYGFNPGSTLSAMDFVGIGRVATNTTLAACAAGLTSIIYGYFTSKPVQQDLLKVVIVPGRFDADVRIPGSPT